VSEKNPDLLAVSQTLNDVANRIHVRKSQTDDPNCYSALNKELIEVNHRITMIGGLIFRERAAAIVTAAKRVQDSKEELVEAIKKIENLNNFIRTVSSFLGLVDKVIDIAKRIA
jgi:hypothetical protein